MNFKCKCNGPGFCEIFQQRMGPRRFAICRNECPIDNYCYSRLKYLRLWNSRLSSPLHEDVFQHARYEKQRYCKFGEFHQHRNLVNCSSCKGIVLVKVFSCIKHEQCTISKPMDSIACCATCPDYKAPT